MEIILNQDIIMIKTNLSALNIGSYSRPECTVLEFNNEGVLCLSSSAGNIVRGDELEDYTQIY